MLLPLSRLRPSLRVVPLRVLSLLVVFLLNCTGGSDLLLPGDGQPASIAWSEGQDQTARVGEPLDDPLVFTVMDSRGLPVAGAQVVFSVAQAGPGAITVPETATSDANGRVQTEFQLGTTIGPQTGEASVLMPEGTQQPKATFTATAVSENANGITAVSGDGQSGPAGSTLAQLLVVQVTDAFGNPISGVHINWSVEGGGSVSESSTMTDQQGLASVSRILGTAAGPQSTTASSEGLAGSPVTFTHTATAGDASLLSIVSGDGQTALAGAELPGDLVVLLVDAQGNGVSGAPVTWVVGMGGGHVTPENTVTDEAGRSSTRWTLGPRPGDNRVDAVVSGLGVVHFQASGTSSRPAALAIVTQPSASTRNGARLDRQPVVQVKDGSGGNASVAGILITAQLAGGGGALLGTRQLTTNSSGQVGYTDLGIAGAAGTRTLVFTAQGYAGVTSTPIQVQAISTVTTITGDTPEPSDAGAAVTVSFTVSAEGVVPLGQVTVTDGQQSCTGTLAAGAGSCQLTITTAGSRTLRATYPGSPGLTGSSDTEEHQVNAPPPPNQPPTAAFTSSCTNMTCSFTDGSSDPDGNVVGRSWNFGDGGSSPDPNPSHAYGSAGTYQVTLTVTDNDGATKAVTHSVNVSAPPPPNQPPAVEFTANCKDLGCSFDPKGTTDPDGNIVSRSWNFGDGASSNEEKPSHLYAAAGNYNVTLTVTDNDGASSSVTHQVSVNTPPPPPNKPPHADFDVSCTDLACTFTDKSTDEDGTIVSRSWDYGDGSSGTTPSHTYTTAGKYRVTLTVTDDRGGTDSRMKDVEAKAPPPVNQPPVAAFSAPSCTASQACQFNDGSSDPDGKVTDWDWNFGDGSPHSTSENPSHTYAGSGNFPVTLTVTDDDGATNSATHSVTVAAPPPPPNQPPHADFDVACSNLDCTFTDHSTDADGTIVSRNWDYGDGSSGATPSHTYSSAGKYHVTLTVTDDDGAANSQTKDADAKEPPNQPPTAAFTPPSCTTNQACQFTDASSDDGSLVEWDWDFSDGPHSPDQNPSHTFSTSGTYTVKLKVKDNDGASSEIQHDVVVSDPETST